MVTKMRFILLFVVLSVTLSSISCQNSIISGYGPVSLEELHPLTLSWNQVHYLVRDSLMEIEELAQIHDEFYKELHDCFGLEKCIKQANLLGGPPQSGRELGAGAFLDAIRRQRIEELAGRHSSITESVNFVEDQLRQRQEQQRRQQQEEQQRRQQQEEQRRQQQQQQRQGGQQRSRQQQQQSSSSSSSFRSSRTGSSSSSSSSSSAPSTSWSSSSSTYERKFTSGGGGSAGAAQTGGTGSTYRKPSTSGQRFDGGRHVQPEEYDDYDDGPVPNRG